MTDVLLDNPSAIGKPVDPDAEISADTPIGKFRARGADLISVMLAAWLGLLTYGLYMHTTEAKASAEATRTANKEIAALLASTNKEVAYAMQQSLKVQRFTACLSATRDSEKENQYTQPNSFCNRMAQ